MLELSTYCSVYRWMLNRVSRFCVSACYIL
jgi:hypothetical protein